jgi:ADP-ribose pyrophosphatase
MTKNNDMMKQNRDEAYYEETIDQKDIYKGHILTLELHTVRLPNGAKSTREVIRHNGACAILPVKDDKLVLVRQYRKALDEILLEIPAGKLEKDEDPMHCAVRELQEETGYHAEHLELLMEMYPAAGYSSERIYIYKAENLSYVGASPDEDEFVGMTEVPFEELYKKVLAGEIKDSKTICAVLKYAATK